MKSNRQEIIIEIITENNIETQFQLQEALLARGIDTTQSTLSRDIKSMRLTKELMADGSYRYMVPKAKNGDNSLQRLKNILREGLVSFDIAQNILVIKTMPGLASAAAAAFDSMKVEKLVGTLAGDDTAFLAMKDNEAALKLYRELETLF